MKDDPDFNIKGPDIEYVSYGPNLSRIISLLFILVVLLIVVLLCL